jgi:hypothetical protein
MFMSTKVGNNYEINKYGCLVVTNAYQANAARMSSTRATGVAMAKNFARVFDEGSSNEGLRRFNYAI